jgi:hypothetical protein
MALPAPKHAARGLAFAPGGALAALLQRQDGRDSVALLACADWQPAARWAAATSDAEELAWAPDGFTLALWDAAGAVVLHALDGAPLGRYGAEAALGARCCAWSPDAGAALAAVGTHAGVVALLARSRGGAPAAELVHAAQLRGPPSAAVYREVAAAPGAAARYDLDALPVALPPRPPADKAKAGIGARAARMHACAQPAPATRR